MAEAIDALPPHLPRCYVHNGREFDLRIEMISRAVDPAHGRVLVLAFMVIRRDTSERNRLELKSSDEAVTRRFPIGLKYQPDFWLRLRFTLRRHFVIPAPGSHSGTKP